MLQPIQGPEQADIEMINPQEEEKRREESGIKYFDQDQQSLLNNAQKNINTGDLVGNTEILFSDHEKQKFHTTKESIKRDLNLSLTYSKEMRGQYICIRTYLGSLEVRRMKFKPESKDILTRSCIDLEGFLLSSKTEFNKIVEKLKENAPGKPVYTCIIKNLKEKSLEIRNLETPAMQENSFFLFLRIYRRMYIAGKNHVGTIEFKIVDSLFDDMSDS